jgi:spermidine synthase
MADLDAYWKRLSELPGIVRRPEDAKLEALRDGGARILVEEQTDFQRILLIETPKQELMLLLDGEIQFYSGDEHRFHEALRELLRHFGSELELICIVDIDPAITELARTHPRLVELNQGSLLDERVRVINGDALTYRSSEPFDLMLCDLPDPTSPILGRLYNQEFYAQLRSQLEPQEGLLAVQIVYIPPLFDGVLSTLRSVFPHVKEYAVWMYSFVRAGFALCGHSPFTRFREVPDGARHLSPESLDLMFYFAPDEPRAEIDAVSSDENQLVEEWYEAFLRDYFEERILYY